MNLGLCSGLVLFAFHSLMFATYSSALEVDIYVSEPEEINTTSALIKGPTEMMVVSAQPNISAAKRLAKKIDSTGLKLKYIFLTHAHLDHFQGASILLEQFPEAQFIATPKVAALQKIRIEVSDEIAVSRYGDNAAVPSIPAQPYSKDTIMIDGETVEIMHGYVGDVALGHDDEEHSVLYVPSAHTLIPSDIIYYNAHVMLGGSTKASRKIWMNQIEEWLKQDFAMAIPGHMPKGSNLTAEGALKHTYEYIKAYDEVMDNKETAEEVIAEMKRRYPNIQHESALLIGTYINFKVMHKLLFNPTVETIFSFLPNGLATWFDRRIFKQRRAAWNGEENE